MSGSQQFPEWELHAEGEEDGDVVLRRTSSESDFFLEFFGPLSSNVSPRISLADATAVATARVVGAGEEEVESTGNKEGKLRASTSGAKLTKEVGVPQQKRKRKRTTEMHNMTERRRRDKIKGKLKALQQLIPNSHKLDRASLLDEAIAYMKSLQLQLQIMSGGGLCHSPCVSPGAMPCLHMHHFSPFSRIGMGYGMGMAGIACPVRPPLMSIPSPLPAASLVSMPGLSTIPTFCPLSQPVPFVPLPEFPAAVATPTPSSPALQTGPFNSLHREDTDSQEAAKTQKPNLSAPNPTKC